MAETSSATGKSASGQVQAVAVALLATVVLALLAARSGAGLGVLALAAVAVFVILLWVAVAAAPAHRVALLASVPLHLMVISMFIEGVGVGELSAGRFTAALATAVIGLRVLTGWMPDIPPTWTWLPTFAFAGWVVASGFWAVDQAGWFFAVGQMALAVIFFGAFALLLRDIQDVRRLLRTFALSAIAAAAVGIVQYLALAEDRAVGLQGDPNIYALYEVTAIPVVWVLSRTATKHWARVAWAMAVVPLVLALLASGSRGGLLTLAITVLVSVIYLVPRGGGRRLLATVGVSAAFAGAGIVAMLTNERLQPDRILNDRASGRLDIWLVALKAWLEHPFLGIGAGSFKPISLELLTTTPGVSIYKGHLFELSGIEVHSLYLQTLVETGVLGISLLALAAVAPILAFGRALRRWPNRFELRALPPMLFTFLAASFSLSLPNGKPFWIMVGLGAALMVMDGERGGKHGTVTSTIDVRPAIPQRSYKESTDE